jgi:hypothetical protein
MTMSSKVVLLKRNAGDDEQYNRLQAIQPSFLLSYSSGSELALLPSDFGNQDYLLVTGGHGDFRNGTPTKFNDSDIKNAMTWIKGVKGSFKGIILDTCYSAALAGSFLPLLPNGGCLVCAYGPGEGYRQFLLENPNKTVGAALSILIDNAYYGPTTMGIVIRKPVNPLLHTGMFSEGGEAGLVLRPQVGMEVDGDESINALTMSLYLRRDGITVVETGNDKLKEYLTTSLTMTVV